MGQLYRWRERESAGAESRQKGERASPDPPKPRGAQRPRAPQQERGTACALFICREAHGTVCSSTYLSCLSRHRPLPLPTSPAIVATTTIQPPPQHTKATYCGATGVSFVPAPQVQRYESALETVRLCRRRQSAARPCRAGKKCSTSATLVVARRAGQGWAGREQLATPPPVPQEGAVGHHAPRQSKRRQPASIGTVTPTPRRAPVPQHQTGAP